MSDLWRLLIAQAPLLAWGVTLLLFGGCICIAWTRSPVHRQRLGELTLLATVAWLLLALVPLPRLWPTPLARNELRVELPELWAATDEITLPGELPLFSELWEGEADPLTPLLPEVTIAPPVAVHVTDEATLPVQAAKPQAEVTSRVVPRQAAAPLPKPGDVLLFVLMGGAGVCLLSLALGHLLLLRLRLSAEHTSPWLGELYDGLLVKSQIPRTRLLVSRRTNRALSWGVWSPVIVLPQALCRRESESQLRTVLWHELGHVAQRDAWGNLLLCLALPLLYWNPLYWWLRGQMQLAAELVADDWAAARIGKETYVEHLVGLAQSLRGNEISLVGVAGVFSVPSQFYRRMDMLLARETPLATRPSARWRLGAMLVCGLVIAAASLTAGVRPAPAQAPAAATPPPPTGAVPPPVAPKADPAPGALPPVGAPPVPALPDPVPTPPRAANAAADDITTLLAKIRELSDRLKALEGKDPKPVPTPNTLGLPALRYGVGAPPAAVPGKTPHVVLMRTDEKGQLYQEIWSVDESGKPDKLIQRTEGAAANKYAYPTPAKAVAAPPAAEPAGAPATGATRVVTRAGWETASAAGSAKQLDLVTLATFYADAVGAVELTKAQLATIEPLAKSNSVSQQELTTARLGQQNAQRKEQLLRRIAEVALAGAKQEMERETKAFHGGLAPSSAATEAQARVEILQQILGSSGEGSSKVPPNPGNLPKP